MMTDPVTLPLWLFVLLVLLSVWWGLERLLAPSVRWFFRRKINRVLDEIGARLEIEIRPFQLTKRQVLIDRLVYDPRVMEAVDHFAHKWGAPREMVQEEVRTYAREIVPSFNAYMYFRLGYWIAKKAAHLMYRVRMYQRDPEAFRKIDPKASVVFVMNHRSNMDYILVAFLAAERTTMSYAVGEWARIWPLQTLIRFMGAFFVRRNSKNTLYRLVLERYISMATREGVTQAVFPEGGLSRDGWLRPPKMGLVDYMLRGFDPDTDRDIVFIPVGINYERVIEDRSLLRYLDPTAKKRSPWFVINTTLRFILRNLWQMVRGRWRRFGYACVNFGAPISIGAYCREKDFIFSRMDINLRREKVQELCQDIMTRIGQVIPVPPLCLTARVLADAGDEGLDQTEIKTRIHVLITELENRGASVYRPAKGLDPAAETALDMLVLRRIARLENGQYFAEPTMKDVLAYYANSIGHLLG